MKYGRGRIIAVTLLSVAIAMVMSVFGVLWENRQYATKADENTIEEYDPNYKPTFDDLFQRVPFAAADSGQYAIGNGTFTLRDECYKNDTLTNFLNAGTRQSFDTMADKRAVRSDGTNSYYPIFSNDEMRSIVSGVGGNVAVPVIMLDPINYDHVVLLELLNLSAMPNIKVMRHNGVTINPVTVNLTTGQNEGHVYAGIETINMTPAEIRDLVDAENARRRAEIEQHNNELLVPNDVNDPNYIDPNDPNNYVDASTINVPKTYRIGAVGYNNNHLRGMFYEEGYYEFEFDLMIVGPSGLTTSVDLAFSFYIVHKGHYLNYPTFPASNRVSGISEVYNYCYGDTYPKVNYAPNYFDVKIQSAEKYKTTVDYSNGNTRYEFYNIGEYKMTATMKYIYRSPQGNVELTLDRYRPYESVLNILGFQMYYGGYHTNQQYSGPAPFYDEYTNCDITTWVNREKLGLSDLVSATEAAEPSVTVTTKYAQALTEKIDEGVEIEPLRTNFPPVELRGNVNHAAGQGVNLGTAIISTVAFRGMGDATGNTDWQYSSLEVGKPFTDAGTYVVMVYFKVNGKLRQQIFYFTILNSIDIQFEVWDGVTTKTYSYDYLIRNKSCQGKNITIKYNGNTTLGKFEVPPVIKLSRADLGSLNFVDTALTPDLLDDLNINPDDGSFYFRLLEGRYRLTVTYGAYGQASTIIELIVDNTKAKNIVASSTANGLPIPNDPVTGEKLNAAIFGAGDVSLTWDKKASGIAYSKVTYDFYQAQTESVNADPNQDRNYNGKYDPDKKNLFAASAFDLELTKSALYIPVATETGWTINEKFTAPGLYKIMIEDEVGNQTNYVLIIDDSRPTFVQETEKVSGCFSNAVEFNPDKGVKVGFGTRKLVVVQNSSILTGNEFEILTQAGYIVTETRNKNGINSNVFALSVGLAQVEYSINGGIYQSVSTTDLANGYMILNSEDTFYFRVIDTLGNLNEYYIILTHDKSLGMIYAESSAKEFSMDQTRAARGMIDLEPNSSTSLVTAAGGMTNRRNVTFSFRQVGANEHSHVGTITVTYYPFDLANRGSKNYPFAETALPYIRHGGNEGVVYRYQAGDRNGTYRIALYNPGEATKPGLYIISRKYDVYNAEGSLDRDPREYYFIVDRQEMLYYQAGVYESDLMVRFGADNKIAYAADFDANKYTLNSNRAAEIIGYRSKYNNTIDYQFNDKWYNFPSLIPRFSYMNNGKTNLLGEGEIYKTLGLPRTADIFYKLIVADNARNFSAVIENGGATELISQGKLTSANYSVLTLSLDTGFGTKANIIRDDLTITTAQMQYNQATSEYVYIMDPKGLRQLQFKFETDPTSFYANVDVAATTNSWRSQEFANAIDLQPTVDGINYIYDILGDFLSGANIANGASVAVTVITEDHQQTIYRILFDTRSPESNLMRIKQQDNLAKDLNTLPQNYIFGLGNDFEFKSDLDHDPYLDTKEISYREVDNSGEGSQAKVNFALNSGKKFSEIVGLRDNEMKFYRITETDYAGHITSYIVQLQGDQFNGDIVFIGSVSEPGSNMNLGIEMHVSSSSAHQFFLNNNSFKFVSGDEYYAVFGSTAEWFINGQKGTGAKSETMLIETLNNWINLATERGEKCVYRLYDRIGDIEEFEFYNIRENAPKLKLDAYIQDASSTSIKLDTTNYDELPILMTHSILASSTYYQIKIEDVTNPNATVPNLSFTLGSTMLQGLNVNHDYIIRVIDPFGRITTTEYHKQGQGSLSFITYGNTVKRDGMIYVGDSKGVDFKYLRTVYVVNIYNAADGSVISNLQPFINGDLVTYSFRPSGNLDTSMYRIQAIGKSSNEILFEQVFAFDTRLPLLVWKNAGEEDIPEIDNMTITGAVKMTVVSNETIKFGYTISYTRTVPEGVERVTLKSNTNHYQFNQVGKYVVTVRNEIWATQTYTFEIAEISDSLISVYDDGKRLEPSSNMYYYNQQYIPHYIFTLETMINENDEVVPVPLTNCLENGLDPQTEQSNRVWVSRDGGTKYYSIDPNNGNTLIWCLASPNGYNAFGKPIYTSEIYFATTGVMRNDLNEDLNLSLIVNGGDPISRAYDTHKVMKANDIKNGQVTVQIHPGNVVDNNLACFGQKGNLVMMDCYRNGELVASLRSDEVFTIGQYDAGCYEFKVHDLVGNILRFGNESDQTLTDHYTVVVLTKPLVLINDSNPVNGMVYNDRVKLEIVNYADEFLIETYGVDYFEEYFKIVEMSVNYNGEVTDLGEQKHDVAPFYWSASGDYRVTMKYRIGDQVYDYVDGEYAFQIVSSRQIMENFSLNVYPDIKIVSVKRDGYPVFDYEDITIGKPIKFSAETNTGRYEVILQSHDNINGDRLHTIVFNIAYRDNNTMFFWLDAPSGAATTGRVTLTYLPTWLYYMHGEVTINIYKNQGDAPIQTIVIDEKIIEDMDFNLQDTFSTADAGMYSVEVFDAVGDVIYSDSWTINATQSPIGMIVTAIVAAVAGVGLLLFIRLRRKMTVK